MTTDDFHHQLQRRLDRLERETEKANSEITQLIISTQRMADLIEVQTKNQPKLDRLITQVHNLEMGLSNAQLVQRGVVWLAGIVGSSAVAMAMAFLFGVAK